MLCVRVMQDWSFQGYKKKMEDSSRLQSPCYPSCRLTLLMWLLRETQQSCSMEAPVLLIELLHLYFSFLKYLHDV